MLDRVSLLHESTSSIFPSRVMPLKIKILERASLAEPELCIDRLVRIVQNTSMESNIQTTYNIEDIISPKGIAALILEEQEWNLGGQRNKNVYLYIPILACSYIHCNFNMRMNTALPGILHLSVN